MKRDILLTLLMTVSLLSFGKVYANQLDHTVFMDDVKSALEDPLPSITETVPGYARPSKHSQGLIIADFTSRAEDEMPWGGAVGRILRWKIMFCPGVILRVPDVNTYYQDASSPSIDKKDAGRSLESIGIAGKRLGIQNALTGHIKVEEPRYEMELQLRELPSGSEIKNFHFSGVVEELPTALGEAVVQIYESLGVALDLESRQYVLRKTPSTFEELKNFTRMGAEFRGKSREEKFRFLNEVWRRGTMPLTAALYLYYMDPGSDLESYHGRLDEVAAVFPEDAGIAFTVARYRGYKDNARMLDEKIIRLKQIAAKNPQDPTAMIVLGDVLAGSGRCIEAITVCMESLERWPDNYRAWWNISWALIEYAWQLRGTNFWQDVPDKAKRLFPKLKNLADKAADKALEMNADNADLWVLKMKTLGEYSPELMESFHKAIRLDPNNRSAYETALNYTLPQWGGSYAAQEEVWNLAVKNNGGQKWLEEIRREYMVDPPLTYKIMRTLTSAVGIAFIFGTAIVVIVTIVVLVKHRNS